MVAVFYSYSLAEKKLKLQGEKKQECKRYYPKVICYCFHYFYEKYNYYNYTKIPFFLCTYASVIITFPLFV